MDFYRDHVICAILCSKFNVTINAPACSPRVFDEDALLAVLSAETKGENTVAKFGPIDTSVYPKTPKEFVYLNVVN